jgi:hypothetical protein
MVLLILVVLNILTACLSSRAAEMRGRSAKSWMWLGIFFGPLAWLTVLLLPAIQEERTA